jgi:hypothetical protein
MMACSGPGAGNGQNEDGWFTQCLLALGKNVANKTHALPFSVETVYHPTPCILLPSLTMPVCIAYFICHLDNDVMI